MSEDSEILPEEVYLEKKNPNNDIMAQIVKGEQIEGFNPLGSEKRFYLLLKYPKSQHLLLRDLSEGFGTYESAITDLKWIDSAQIYIERIISDNQADLIYDILDNSWKNVFTN